MERAEGIAGLGSSPLRRSLRYLVAPFLLSEWKKSAPEKKQSAKEKLRTALVKVGLYYLLFSPLVAMPFYNTCIFHPFVCGDYDLKEIAGVKKSDIYFSNSKQERLHGWYLKKPDASKTVLLSHGNAGNLTHRQGLIKQLLNSGASVFIYDYAGYGLSHGSPSVDGCCRDALAAYDCLHNDLKVPANSIILYGESLGTAISCQLAKQRESAGLILQSPFQSLPQIAQEKMPLFCVYPRGIFPCNQLDTLSYLTSAHPPLLLIHGQADDIIPAHNSEDLYKAASGEKQILRIAGTGHNDVPEHFNFESIQTISRFLH